MPDIRAAIADDAPAVLALWDEAGSEPGVSDDVDAIALLVTRDPGALLVADDAGRVVGSVIAGFDGWRGHIHRLAVAPSHRRRGLATALVRAGEERLRSLGARRAAAIFLPDHGDATGFWTAIGYTTQANRARVVRNL